MNKNSKMRVLYDYQVLEFQKYGGISRYFFELYSAFITKYQKDIMVKLPVFYSYNYYFSNFAKQRNSYLGRIGKIINQKINRLKVVIDIYFNYFVGKPYDIIHPTYYFPEYLKYIPKFIRKKSRVIITVHDLIQEMYYPPDESLKKRAELIQHADGIIAISEKTKEDLLRIYPSVSENRITVIYHGCTMKQPDGISEIQFPLNYILMVGNRGEYKNGIIVFEAFAKIKNIYDNLKLVCVGGGKFSDDEISIINELGINENVTQMSLSDKELFYAYKNAKCFVFPSLYEGFGIPILEAFFCECPIILSNTSCFPEIAGDCALYFDPHSAEELAEQIELLVDNPNIAEELVKKGQERLKLFKWEYTTEKTLEFYREIMGEEKCISD